MDAIFNVWLLLQTLHSKVNIFYVLYYTIFTQDLEETNGDPTLYYEFCTFVLQGESIKIIPVFERSQFPGYQEDAVGKYRS